jgi:hypothetical protein
VWSHTPDDNPDLLRSLGSGTLGWDNIGEIIKDGDVEVDYAPGEYRGYGKSDGPSPWIEIGIEIACTASNRDRDSDGRAPFLFGDVYNAIFQVKEALKEGGLGHLEVNSYVVSTISC